MKYREFIEDNFLIINKQGQIVPFIFNKVQNKYYADLLHTFSQDLIGVRDVILKARKEGFSSLILAIFAVDFLLAEHPIASVCIADTKGETIKLLKRAKFYIESYIKKKGGSRIEDICEVASVNELKNRENGAVFWIGTAGSRIAPRVETVQNLHFSEAAHFLDAAVITAKGIIEGASQMVEQGSGRIFIESTANGYGNYYQELWELASNKLSEFRPVFFSANEFYSEEWLRKKERSFTSRAMFKQEYPNTSVEAFIMSGDNFFDKEVLDVLYKRALKRKPLYEGDLLFREGI